jgi:heat shock protein HslJ
MRTLHAGMKPPPGRAMRRAIAGRTLAEAGRRMFRLLVVLTLAASGGCGSSGGTTPDTVPLQTGVEWQLETLAPPSGPPVLVNDPSLYTVRFNANGTLEARADCNRCGGAYRITGASMTIGPLGCTLAACPVPTLGDQFSAALSTVASYVQTPTELVLTGASGTLHFRARP